MGSGQLQRALQAATETASVTIGRDARLAVADDFRRLFGDQPAVVVADEITYDVAGREVQQRLSTAGRRTQEPYLFPGQPSLHADFEHVLALEAALRLHAAIPVAVGSGTLNDITKLAAHRCGRPYLVVATAASMDGYTAFGAAITRAGYKQTMVCPAPRAVVADTQLLVQAPAAMTAAGYADLLGKVTAGADWLIADALGIEPLDARAWELVQTTLRDWIGRPAELRAGDEQAMASLIEGLLLAGLAMQAAQSSRPASGSEHLFSHLWEMEGLGHDRVPPLSHGFKVGLGSIASAALYEHLLPLAEVGEPRAARLAAWPTRTQLEQAVQQAHPVPGLRAAAVTESLAKHLDAAQLERRLEQVAAGWPALRERLRAQLLPADQLRQMLAAAGCPTTPAEIGLSGEALRDTYFRARQIRRRYTVLDLAAETGLLAECVQALFAPAGFWGPVSGLDPRSAPARPGVIAAEAAAIHGGANGETERGVA